METAEIRRRWLNFFADRGHTVVPSAPLLYDDPNLLFVNAGMVPFKPFFLGQETPPYRRATSVQKCVRTQDIEEVGKTTRHGTFFQMNGNFSFGDYFKQGAVEFAWELITKSVADGGYGLDESKLWVTVYHEDDEAIGIWKQVAGLPDERIVRRGKADNFWSMGVPGPCGPCSEIYIDRGPAYGPDGGPEVDEDRFLEFWNLVFMQFERGPGEDKENYPILGPLPAANIDTGLGLERLAYMLQGVDNLYEIDEVFPVIGLVEQLSGRRYRADHTDDVRMRVVADHVRSGLMLMGDGVTPSNEARGYVLRRLLRRAVRSIRLLGVEDPVLVDLLATSKDRMKASYPELEAGFGRIANIAQAEEESFRRTLASGTTILDVAVRETKSAGSSQLAGAKAFQLHDTYGFPIDLTLEMAAEQGLDVDREGFVRLMAEQRARAKADARAKKGGHGDVSIYRETLDSLGKPVDFTGYRELTTEGTVVQLIGDGGVGIVSAGAGSEIELVLDRTPFYAESGGQIADEGRIVTSSGAELQVLDVQRPIRGLIVHKVKVLSGEIGLKDGAESRVDPEWRLSACQAHSATHVVHAALRQVLGPTALQSGSYNKPGYLRLDFAWNQGLSEESRTEVEDVANQALRRDLPVSASYMSLPEAQALGALALFGETYGEQVRVVEIGGPWSRELCGGTHVAHSSQIGVIAVTGESSVGAGLRRVEAFVGIDAFRYLARERALVTRLADAVKARPEELPDRVAVLVAQVKDLQKEIDRSRAAQVLAVAGDLARRPTDVFGVSVVTHNAGTATPEDIRSLTTDVRGRLAPGRPSVVAVAGVAKDRPVVVIATNDEARRWGVKAGSLVREAASVLGGGGGGKDDIAQGGGTDATKIAEALSRVEYVIGQTVTAGA